MELGDTDAGHERVITGFCLVAQRKHRVQSVASVRADIAEPFIVEPGVVHHRKMVGDGADVAHFCHQMSADLLLDSGAELPRVGRFRVVEVARVNRQRAARRLEVLCALGNHHRGFDGSIAGAALDADREEVLPVDGLRICPAQRSGAVKHEL